MTSYRSTSINPITNQTYGKYAPTDVLNGYYPRNYSTRGCVWFPKNGNIPGLGFDYGSLPMYCQVVSVLLSLIAFIGVGAAADYGSARRTMLLITTAIGSALCMGVMAFYHHSLYWGNALMMIFSNLSFGAAVIFYNAYLPLLVGASEDIVDLLEDESSTPEEISSKIDETTARISSYGPAFGYVGQGIMLMVNLVIFAMMSDTTFATQLNCAISGAWTLLFGILSWSRLKDRPGPALPKGEGYFSQGLKDVSQTMRHLQADLPNLGKFLTAYFIYSDGTSTLSGAASQFAAYELDMGMTQVLLGLLEVSFLAPLGCFFWLWVQNSCGVKPKTIIYILLLIFLGMCIYAFFAMTAQIEFYVLCAVYAFVAGAEQAFTRGL